MKECFGIPIDVDSFVNSKMNYFKLGEADAALTNEDSFFLSDNSYFIRFPNFLGSLGFLFFFLCLSLGNQVNYHHIVLYYFSVYIVYQYSLDHYS